MIHAKLSNLVFNIITEFNTLSSKRRKNDNGSSYLICGTDAAKIISAAKPFFNEIKDGYKEMCAFGNKIGMLNGCLPVYINNSLPTNKLCFRIENFNCEVDKNLNLEDFKEIWQ